MQQWLDEERIEWATESASNSASAQAVADRHNNTVGVLGISPMVIYRHGQIYQVQRMVDMGSFNSTSTATDMNTTSIGESEQIGSRVATRKRLIVNYESEATASNTITVEDEEVKVNTDESASDASSSSSTQ
jgi:hypothetical protein